MSAITGGRRVRRAVVAWAIGAGVLRATLWAPEVCPVLSVGEARTSARSAGGWMAGNQLADGRFRYGWHRGRAETVAGYNDVRHAGVTLSLYQLAEAGEDQFLESADRGLRWMLDQVEPAGPGAVAFVSDGTTAKLGSSSLLALGLAIRREATGDRRYDRHLVALGHFLTGQQRDDGSMLNRWDPGTGRPVPDETSIFATGEALWALARLHELFPDEGFDAAAWRTLDFLATERDRSEGFFPQPWPDQWAAYALEEMGDWGLRPVHVAYARRLLGRFGLIVRFDAQRGDRLGALTHGPSQRGASTGTWVEAMGALWRLTGLDPRLADLEAPARAALACAAARLADRQVGPGARPEEAGAWFYADETRMDDQQHAASGILRAEAALEEQP